MVNISTVTLRRAAVLKATTTDGLTKDFNHMLPTPRHWRTTGLLSGVVPPKDRIKFWNIVPGDQVRVMGAKLAIVREVLSINKFTNEVFLKTTASTEDIEGGKRNKGIHYSKLQLYIGEREIMNKKTGKLDTVQLFAKRMGQSGPRWDSRLKSWDWQRFAVATTPRIPSLQESEDEDSSKRINIPWPLVTRPTVPKAGAYDTPEDVARERTYEYPDFLDAYHTNETPTLAPFTLPIAPERVYLASTLDPSSAPPANQPFEVYLAAELSNPHSRTKKQRRWQERNLAKKALLKEITAEEMRRRALDGRSTKAAKKDAFWRWKLQVEEDRQAEMKRRWRNRGGETRLVRKRVAKMKKAARLEERMRNLVLEAAPNQVIPSGRSDS